MILIHMKLQITILREQMGEAKRLDKAIERNLKELGYGE